MIDKPLLFLIAKLTAIIAAFVATGSDKADVILMIISALSYACVFITELLVYRIKKNRSIIMIFIIGSLTGCFAIGLEILFPLFVLLLLHLFDLTVDGKMFYQITSVAVLLSLYIFQPDKIAIILSLCLFIMTLIARHLLNKLTVIQESNELQKETISEMDKKLKDLRGLMKTLKNTASIEERNRIAARIHDEIGHGISGSIIMLEAALLIMKEQPEKAATNIERAVNNLRDGVDEIRTALREERAGHYILGINEITSMLEEFKVTYNKAVVFNTTGDINNITLDIWACIHDNLKECLSNLLKHSNATLFTLNIEVYKKIIKVEYKDNGRSEAGFEKDMGLEAIEERTVNARGRCFFNKSLGGFCVTNIFTY